jgi:hypothetical protein
VPLITPPSDDISQIIFHTLEALSNQRFRRTSSCLGSTEDQLRIMPPISLVTLAASLREALDSPLVAESKVEQEARLDIIDMIPVLNRRLVGEVQTIRDMAWEVRF